jgi:hypothetical protein
MYSCIPTVFCKGFLLVLLVFPLVTRRLEISHSLDSVSIQGETITTPKISGLEGTPDGVDETAKPDEEKSAELVKPVETAPAEDAKAVLPETVMSTAAPLDEAAKPADTAPIGAAKSAEAAPPEETKLVEGAPTEVAEPTDAHFDSEPMLGTIFSRSAVHPSTSYDD